MVTTYELFERAERVELLSAAIYGAVAERFREDLEARALFLRLQEEELQHARRVRLLAARYRHDGRLLPRAPADRPSLDQLVADGEAVLESVRAGRLGQDLAAVKRSLAALEGRFQDAHAELIASAGHPELRRFFEQLARGDAAHARLLAL